MRPIILAVLVPLAACGNFGGDDNGAPGVQGSGTGNAREYPVTDFTAVDLRGADDVDVRVGGGFSVRAEGDSATLDRLKIERVGDTLRIGRVRSSIPWTSRGKVKVFVTMPRVSGASVAGSGDMLVDRVEGSGFDGSIAGSGNLSVGRIAVDSAELSIAGSGNLTVAGEARAFEASIAGSGDVKGDGLRARRADISIAGSGSVRALVDGDAEISLMGSGDVDLGPKARCKTSKMGSGTVRCGG